MKELFEKYAQLKKAEKELATEIAALAPKIIEAMGDNEEVTTDNGLFALGHRRKWQYPADIEAEEKRVKELKKEAEQAGIADYEETTCLIFRNE